MPGDLRGIQGAQPFLQLERAAECLLDAHLLVEHHADQERHGVAGEKAVGLVVVGEIDAVWGRGCGHARMVFRATERGGAARRGAVRSRWVETRRRGRRGGGAPSVGPASALASRPSTRSRIRSDHLAGAPQDVVPWTSATPLHVGVTGRVQVFRVPQRGTAQPVVAPPDRPTWHGTLVGQNRATSRRGPRQTRTAPASDRLRVAPWESIPAPWGEPENPIPYVVITTQPWPEEWWRPNAVHDANGSPIKAARPASQLASAVDRVAPVHANGAGSNGTGLNGSAPLPVARQKVPFDVEVIPVDRGEPMPPTTTLPTTLRSTPRRGCRRPSGSSHAVDCRRSRHPSVEVERERLATARTRRRGMLTRLAIFAAGLVISLIAVETASRRRS